MFLHWPHKLLLTLFQQLQPLFSSAVTKHSLIDELFITLVKLRLGIPHKDLAYRMNVSESAVGRIFCRWIDVMSSDALGPDKELLALNMPMKHYSNLRCIIDCFEVFIQRPTSFVARAPTY